MFKLLLPLLLLGFLSQVVAQNSPKIIIENAPAGTDYRTGSVLTARTYAFDQPVFKVHLPGNRSSMTVLLGKKDVNGSWKLKGKAMTFDPVTGVRKWEKKTNFIIDNIFPVGDHFYEQRPNRLSRLDPETGQMLWKRKSMAFKVYPDRNLAICYDLEDNYQTLRGVNLATGKHTWFRGISGEFGWKSTEMLDDSTLMIVGQGIYTVGLDHGGGWDLKRLTYAKKTDMKKVAAAVLVAAVSGSAGYMMGYSPGYMSVPVSGFSDYYTHLTSNVLRDFDAFYFAARDVISYNSMDGKKIWKTQLNEKITAQSQLFREGKTLYMINKGYGLRYGIPTALGNPYVAAFDAETGEQLFLKEWDERKNYIADYLVESDNMYLLFRDRIDIQRFSNFGLTQRYFVKCPENLKFRGFVNESTFIKQDSIFVRAAYDKSHFYVVPDQGDLLRYSNDFETHDRISIQQLYRCYLETDSYVFVGNNQHTLVLDKESYRPVAELDAPANAATDGKKLFFTKGNKAYELDISAYGTPILARNN